MKGERLNKLKKCFDALVGEAKRVSVFAQGASRLNEVSYCKCNSLPHAEVFLTAFVAGAECMVVVFSE